MNQCPSCGGCCHKSGCQRLNTNDKAMWVLGWNECLNAQPPAPSDTAITYMTGYSDGRGWAQTSQALGLTDDEIDALLPTITLKDLDPKQQVWLTKKDAIAFARAIIAAIKQGGQHD